jgi:hypothetical protein
MVTDESPESPAAKRAKTIASLNAIVSPPCNVEAIDACNRWQQLIHMDKTVAELQHHSNTLLTELHREEQKLDDALNLAIATHKSKMEQLQLECKLKVEVMITLC